MMDCLRLRPKNIISNVRPKNLVSNDIPTHETSMSLFAAPENIFNVTTFQTVKAISSNEGYSGVLTPFETPIHTIEAIIAFVFSVRLVKHMKLIRIGK